MIVRTEAQGYSPAPLRGDGDPAEYAHRRGRLPDPIAIAQQMLDPHKQLPAAKTPHEKSALQRQIDTTDRQLDRLVYELYDLTDEEIDMVEGRREGD